MPRTPVCFLALLVAVLLALPQPAAADPVGTQTQVSTHIWPSSSTGGGGFPDAAVGAATAAYNPSSREYLVVWRWNDANEENNFGTIQRRVAADGATIGGEISVRPYPHIHTTALTVGENGNYLRLYNYDMGSGVRIDGAPLTPSLGTPDGAGVFDSDADGGAGTYDEDELMSIAASPGGYLVVWQRQAFGASAPEIRAQRLNISGAEIGDPGFRLVQDNTAPLQAGAPVVATNTRTQQSLVIYRTVGAELKATRINRDGVQIGNEIPIASGVESPAAVSYDPERNEFLAVWQDTDTSTAKHQVFGRFLDAGGQPISLPFNVSQDPASDEFTPDVAYNATAKQYLVVWTDSYEIHGQNLTGDGTLIGTRNFTVSSMGPAGDPAYRARRPRIAPNTDAGEWLITWDGDNPTNQVWARRVAPGSAPPGAGSPAPAPGTPPGTTASPAGPPLVVADAVAPRVRITSARRLKLRTALARGVRVPITCSEACSVTVSLVVTRATANRLHLRLRTLGKTIGKLGGAGKSTLTVRLRGGVRRVLARHRTTRLSIRVVALDSSGNKTSASKAMTLAR